MVKTFIKAQNWTVFLFHFWYWVKRCCFVICFNCFFFVFIIYLSYLLIFIYTFTFFFLYILMTVFSNYCKTDLYICIPATWLNFADYFFKVQLLLCHGACTKLSNQISGKEDWIWTKKVFLTPFYSSPESCKNHFSFPKTWLVNFMLVALYKTITLDNVVAQLIY